jgi:tubulin monoglycylase TTLL3/8
MKVSYGVHRGLGVEILHNDLEIKYREQYMSGKLCGKVDYSVLAQHYIDNPLLFKGYKFDFRIYMMVTSVNPLIVHYHDGFLRNSLVKYDKGSSVSGAHITNTSKSKKIIEECKQKGTLHNGMNYQQLREFQMKTLEDLQEYLLETKKITDPNWLDNYLRPQFKRAFLSMAKMNEEHFYKSSDVFELFGADFVIDNDLNLYIIEVNASPMIIGTASRKTELLTNMMKGLFDIQYAYQFSRTKRALNYLKEKGEEIRKAKKVGKYIKEFESLYRNYLEPEYAVMIKEDNPWHLVYDANQEGRDKYQNLVEEECVDIMEEWTKKIKTKGSKKKKRKKRKGKKSKRKRRKRKRKRKKTKAKSDQATKQTSNSKDVNEQKES